MEALDKGAEAPLGVLRHRLGKPAIHLLGSEAAAEDPETNPAARPRTQLLDRLQRWLPRPPARLILVARDGETLYAPLAKAGYQVEPWPAGIGSWPAETPSGAPAAAALLVEVLASPAAAERALMALRARLAPGGWLIVVEFLVPDGSPPTETAELSSADLDVALGEAGFGVRREADWTSAARPSARWLLAGIEQLEAGGVRLPEDLAGWRRQVERLARGEASYLGRAARREEYFVRAYRTGDEGQILDLFADVFHHRRSLEHWRWQFLDCPSGSLRISLAVDEEDRLAAQYAAYPVTFLHLDGELLRQVSAHQIGDTMTRPDVRHVGRGPSSLLGRTARDFFARFCRGRVAFNYGFNVGNIQRFSTRFLESRRIAPVAFWRRSLPGERLRRPSRLQRFAGLHLERLDELDPRFDELLTGVASAYRFLARRDRAYLEWRYLRRPGFDYAFYAVFARRRLLGWSVFRRREETLLWGDALFRSESVELVERLLAEVLAGELGAGATRIEGWFAPQPAWFRRQLERLGFERRPEPQDLALMMTPFGDEPSPEELEHELYYTLGDSDLF